MATVNPAEPRSYLSGLARRLIADGALSEEKAREIQARVAKDEGSLVSLLVESKAVSAARIAETASIEFGVPLVDLFVVEPDVSLLKNLNERLIRQHRALPLLKRGRVLYVAVSDPTNVKGLDEVKFAAGLGTEAVIVEEDKLTKAIDAALSAVSAASLDMGDVDLDKVEIKEDDADGPPDLSRADADDAPIVRFVHKMLLDAINSGSSDLHFEPYEKTYRVRLRTDGELRDSRQAAGATGQPHRRAPESHGAAWISPSGAYRRTDASSCACPRARPSTSASTPARPCGARKS